MIARERGLEPLADALWAQVGTVSPEALAQQFVNAEKEVPDVGTALAGARDICAERLSEDAELRGYLRAAYLNEGVLRVAKKPEHADKTTKFDMYASFEEPVAKMPSHRFLAIRRGENEGVLYGLLRLEFEPHVPYVRARIPVRQGSPFQAQLEEVVADSLERLLGPAAASDVRARAQAAFGQRSDSSLRPEPAGAAAGGAARRQDRARHRSGPAHGAVRAR